MISDGRNRRMRRRRGGMAQVGLGAVLLLLLAAFFRMQVLGSSSYTLRSEENRLRAVRIPAARGTIYDRNGRVVAENVPGYAISLLPSRRDTIEALLGRLAPFLGLDTAERTKLMERYGRMPKRPLVLRDDATFQQVSDIEERRPAFRGSVVEMRPRRHYPSGPAVAHLIGYVAEVNESELAGEFSDYDAGRIVGRDGVERQYERRLGGTPGVRYVEVNALGAVVRDLGPRPAVPAHPGRDLNLGIDLDLQVMADTTFPEGRRGGVVALDPRTGEVLLLYSHPTFDPNRFIRGIPVELWNVLREDPAKPLLNRVTTATYPPGSTWKLELATIGMASGDLSIGTRFSHACDGGLLYGNRWFRCWKPTGHGSLDLSGAIQQSCNVYFYQAGLKIGLETLTRGVGRLGFNQPTGIDLPYEARGFFPATPDWYDRRYGTRGWTESVLLNLAIGQGENQQTVLRQAVFYTALATGRSPIVPHLARDEFLEARRVPWSLGLPEPRRRELVHALERVVNEPDGTAYPYRSERWRLAGKTGTAQNPQGDPHSWFVGFGPVQNPKIVIAAIVEHGHPDNEVSLAVPYAIRLMERYLEEIGEPQAPGRMAVGEDETGSGDGGRARAGAGRR
ncbi:MAG: penicillin-binding protein 2 [Gemmatimonadota bacterium]